MNFSLLKKDLEKKGFSIRELARQIGLSNQGLSYSIRKGSLKVDTLEKICHVIGEPISKYFGEFENPKTKKEEKQKRSWTVNDRLKELIDHREGGNAAQFAEAIGETRFRVSQVINRKTSFQVDLLEKIMLAYPDTDLYWLVTGKGKYRDRMLREMEEIKKEIRKLKG